MVEHDDRDCGLMNQDAIWEYLQNPALNGTAFAGAGARLGYLARLIAAPAKVLNIGVGAGTFEAQALKRGLTAFSLDPNQKSIEHLREIYGMGDRARVGHSQEIPFADREFDAVVISEVLEHLTDAILQPTLSEIARVLRPGGQIIGTVPARENLTEDTVVCLYCSKTFHRWGHLQSFDPDRLRGLLAAHFSAIRIRERPFVDFPTLNWKGKLQGIVKLLLYSCGVHGKHENMVFAARRPDTARTR